MGIHIPGNSPEKEEDDGPEQEWREDSVQDGYAEAADDWTHGVGSIGQQGGAVP